MHQPECRKYEAAPGNRDNIPCTCQPIPLGLIWGENSKREPGKIHVEWHAPCGCAFHPDPFPHVHPCSDEHKRPDLHATMTSKIGLPSDMPLPDERCVVCNVEFEAHEGSTRPGVAAHAFVRPTIRDSETVFHLKVRKPFAEKITDEPTVCAKHHGGVRYFVIGAKTNKADVVAFAELQNAKLCPECLAGV